MKLGTHVHYTKTSKSSYSAKPDDAWDGCGGHFPKWPPSQKLRGAEPSISTLYIVLWGVDFRKSIAKCTTPFYPKLWPPFYKMAAISKVLRSISETKRCRAFNVDSMYRFCGAQISKNYCQMYHTILSDIVKPIFQNGGHFQSITVYLRN